jgi:hypothetical protein
MPAGLHDLIDPPDEEDDKEQDEILLRPHEPPAVKQGELRSSSVSRSAAVACPSGGTQRAAAEMTGAKVIQISWWTARDSTKPASTTYRWR